LRRLRADVTNWQLPHKLVRAQTHNAALETEVIIVGAGPVGLLLANLLGARGIRTLVFDRQDQPLESSMAIGVTPPSMEILRRLGLDKVFHHAGVPVRYAEVHESRRRLGRLDFAQLKSDYPFFLSIPQARTVEILHANLAQFPSVKLTSGVEFVGLTQDANGVRVELREVRSGVRLEGRSRFLAGCDGHRSVVRGAGGLRVVEKKYSQRFVMADFSDRSGLGNEACLFFGPNASVESFPLPGGWRRWIVLANDLHNEAPEAYLIRIVKQHAGFDLSSEPVQFVSPFGAKRMLVNQYHAGRVVLAGDAAHTMSSIGGQGMNTGFADAEMLAELLPGALTDPDSIFKRFALYDRVRRAAYMAAADRAERGMWLGTLRGRAASLFRKHLIRDVLFSRFMAPRLEPHFAMLTIPFCNLNNVPPELIYWI
jgi:2-polyprenyl-6-methoxyphenol hydroxylase-like FAD-dependent oxidoreductase